jgi:hypothetical protein
MDLMTDLERAVLLDKHLVDAKVNFGGILKEQGLEYLWFAKTANLLVIEHTAKLEWK